MTFQESIVAHRAGSVLVSTNTDIVIVIDIDTNIVIYIIVYFLKMSSTSWPSGPRRCI